MKPRLNYCLVMELFYSQRLMSLFAMSVVFLIAHKQIYEIGILQLSLGTLTIVLEIRTKLCLVYL